MMNISRMRIVIFSSSTSHHYHHLTARISSPSLTSIIISPQHHYVTSPLSVLLTTRNSYINNSSYHKMTGERHPLIQRSASSGSGSTGSSGTTGSGGSNSSKPILTVKNIDKNIELRRYSSSVASVAKRKLAIIFAYMLPKEKHLDKYRNIYFNNGFDVVTVTTSPFEFFFPKIGAQKIASKLIKELINSNQLNNYPTIVIHGFSVGGYQFSEVLSKLYSRESLDIKGSDMDTKAIKKHDHVTSAASDDNDLMENKEKILKSIKGTIFDSPCDLDSVPYGFSRTVAGDTFLAKIIEFLLISTKFLFYPVSSKYHRNGQELFANHPLDVPSLFFASKNDKLAKIDVIRDIVSKWNSRGLDASLKEWENTRHVSHFHAHPEEYTREVNSFLAKVV